MLNSVPLAWLDCRSAQDYSAGHFPNAALFSWPELQHRLNELPAAPANLGVIAPETQLALIRRFLCEKGYHIGACLTDVEFANLAEPGLVVGGNSSMRLWSPNPFLETALNQYLNLEPYLTSRHALDLGCGGGRDAVYLAEQGWQVSAIDQQARVIERAKTLAKHNRVEVNWRCCDLRSQDCLPNQSFDLILMNRFLNRSLYPYMRAHTRPGGYVLISTFVEGVEVFGSPKNPNLIVKKHELAKEFAEFEVIVDKISRIEDGRPVASFLARRLEENKT
ncbi:MAG: methyltransferase domain-containing protein [Thiomicrospira sp.]|uniref:methyltransferase domain-containing protein n=1 Tax=Thiomicrospira sp. TaxID=935 RepID=UPI0019E64F52|nr:methyltransferase domain-containing protein [Thiomicrospira sp.]MBE0493283.1 methyltransferase domain-containing protein [Thiomicrospira sp.]